jgi:hypothetical protein
LEKNLLDLEHNKYFNLFLSCLVLSTTAVSLTLSIITYFGLQFQTISGQKYLILGSIIGFSFLVLALYFHKKYKEKFEEIRELLEKIKMAKD